MADFITIERIFYALGSLIAFFLGGIKLKKYFESPNILIRPYLFFKNKEKNEYGQDVIPLEYEFSVLNTGRDVVGEVLLRVGTNEIHNLSKIINLRKNIPFTKEGVIKIEPVGINIKKIDTPFKVKMFFQDIKGREYAVHEITLGEGGAGWSQTKKSL